MKKNLIFLMVCGLVSLHMTSRCQQKNVVPPMKTVAGKTTPPDSTGRPKHDPRRATLYSAFCPGLGQIYNRQYWKLPIVYAAIGIPAYLYFDNKSWYKKCQYALAVVLSGTTNRDSLNKVDPILRTYLNPPNPAGLVTNRNEYRKDQDYSVIFFLLFWGLQIVDATVDAHLINFDISNEISLRVRAGNDHGSGPVREAGSTAAGSGDGVGARVSPALLGVVLEIHKARYKSMVPR